MPCNVLDIPCHVRHLVGGAVGGVVSSGVDGLARSIQDGVTWMVKNTLTWWVRIPSTDPAGSGRATVAAIQGSLMAITVAVAVGGMIAGGIRMALTRKPDPLLGVARGLVVLAATAALGVVVPAALLRAGDEFSGWVIDRAVAGGDLGGRLAGLLALQGVPAGVVIVLGPVAIAASLLQAVLMMFRQASVLILTGTLLLAASGQFMPATRPWFGRVTGWMLALIAYKPAAALVYAAAFTLAGQGQGGGLLVGFAMLVLSLVALPVLVRLFTWATGSAVGAAGGGAAISAAVSGLTTIGAVQAVRGGHEPAEHARYLAQQVGPAGGGWAGVAAPAGAALAAVAAAHAVGHAVAGTMGQEPQQ